MQSIDGNHNNQAKGDIVQHNYLLNNRVKPVEIELTAIKDYTTLYYVFSFVMLILYSFVVISAGYFFGGEILLMSKVFVYGAIFGSTFLAIVVSIVFLEKILPKIKWGHIKYKNKMLIYKETEMKFYDEIWDMHLKKTAMSSGKIEYFGITPKNHTVYSRKVVFSKYSEAKYVYDMFWSGLKN